MQGQSHIEADVFRVLMTSSCFNFGTLGTQNDFSTLLPNVVRASALVELIRSNASQADI